LYIDYHFQVDGSVEEIQFFTAAISDPSNKNSLVDHTEMAEFFLLLASGHLVACMGTSERIKQVS
jgi:hypothetical protein